MNIPVLGTHRSGFADDALLHRLNAAGISFTRMVVASGWAVVTPALGAKVIGAGVDEENAFWTAPAIRPGSWNAGGQRTWIAPEMGDHSLYFRGGDWSPPATMDPGTYHSPVESSESRTAEAGLRRTVSGENADTQSYECRATLSSASGNIYTVSLGRTIGLRTLPPTGNGAHGVSIRVSQQIVNRDPVAAALGLGLWSIVQVPNRTDAVLIMASHGRYDGLYSHYFGELPSSAVEAVGENLIVRVEQGRRFKLGLPAGKSGNYVCSVRRSLTPGMHVVVIKRFQVARGGLYVDKPVSGSRNANGDAIQVYNGPESGDHGFSEIECHSPSTPLPPGGSLSFEVDIAVWKLPSGDLGAFLEQELSADLAKLEV